MVELLSALQQVSAPLDPKEMTALIQQINNMYQNSFNLYIGLAAIAITLLTVILAAVQAVQWFKGKHDIKVLKDQLSALKKEGEYSNLSIRSDIARVQAYIYLLVELDNTT